MQVILLERVAKLGQMGEVVIVKDGYARNFLLPQGKALRANDNNIKSFEVKKAQLEATNLESRKEAEAATEAGFTVSRTQVVLEKPIKELGLHTVSVRLHPEVAVKIKLNVARSVEEAELQASGKSIQELAAEAEAQAEFEIAELFDEVGAAASEE